MIYRGDCPITKATQSKGTNYFHLKAVDINYLPLITNHVRPQVRLSRATSVRLAVFAR